MNFPPRELQGHWRPCFIHRGYQRKPKTQLCKYCAKSFLIGEEFQTHMDTVHPGWAERLFERGIM